MTVALDLVGKKFGRWSVVKRTSNNRHGSSVWECRCECGTVRGVSGTVLNKGKSVSCGCYRDEVVKVLHKTHGMSYSPEYNSYNAMKQRCYYKPNVKYSSYGGAGITVCDRWLESFENFYKDMGDKPSKSHSLDREDNLKGYSSSNCKWSTKSEQTINRGLFKSNKSGVVGVIWHKHNRRWVASIKENKKDVYLGSYIDKVDASCARLFAEQCLGWDEKYDISTASIYIINYFKGE